MDRGPSPAREALENVAAAKPQVHTQGTPEQRQTHEHTRQVSGCLVVVVETATGRYRRRTFLTLKAAERACQRAEEAGHPASVVVARLEPMALIR
jgi:hypothetical protein